MVAIPRGTPVAAKPSGEARRVSSSERVFHFLYKWSERTRVAVKTTAPPAYRRVLQREAMHRAPGRSRRPRPLAVNDGKGFVFVSHMGDVYRAASCRSQRR
jgi:hypothetical protein